MLVATTDTSGHLPDLSTDARRRLSAPGSRGGYKPPPDGLVQERQLLDLLPTSRVVSEAQQQRLYPSDAPQSSHGPTVYCVGDLSLLQRPCVALVGTRAVSSEGAARTRRLARELVAAGVVVVSGLAKGVDAEAHRAAIEAGGRTIGVIGTAVQKAYPAENKHLQETIYREHLLVSPFQPHEVVQKHFFPKRNRVMAALSDATVIIEASDTSGTLHQAAECVRLGRWLFIARSLLEDRNVTWPKKFLGTSPRIRVLETTQDVLAAVQR